MKKYFKCLGLLLVALLLNVAVVFADDDIATNCRGGDGTNCGSDTPMVISPAPSEEKETTSPFQSGNTVNVKGDIESSAFIAGNEVTVNSEIDGIGFVAGNKVKVSGESDYGFVAGKEVSIYDLYTKDGFFAGYNVSLDQVLARTIYAAATNIKVKDSEIDDLYLSGGEIALDGNFENVTVSCARLIVNGNIYGTLKVNEDAIVEIKDGSLVTKTEKYKEKDTKKEFLSGNTTLTKIYDKATNFVISLLNGIFVGLVLIYFGKKYFDKLAKIKNDAGYVFGKIGIGLCGLIIVPILAIVLLITGVASSLGVLAILAYIASIMITTPVVAIHGGNLLLGSIKNEYLRFIAALAILMIVKALPIIGPLATFLTLCYGLGLIKDMFKTEKKEK